MTLTLGKTPLSSSGSDHVNYTIDGPRHRILFDDFPRRVRARFGGETMFDTTAGKQLHESNIPPVLYVPVGDVRMDLLTATDLSTHCPFKGDAAYWTITVGDRSAENAVWGYPTPVEGAEWLDGYVAFYWEKLDAWFDEDEEVHGHLRDPYHRVDARRSSRRVVVRNGEELIASSSRPIVVSETGFPNRYYLPVADVAAERLVSSTTTTHCPYKGFSTYWSIDGGTTDAAWSYEAPFEAMNQAAGHLCFMGEGITTEVDGVVVEG
ncbi:MAG: DUF427 domain-containing protein [Actinomycetota bacterium]